MTAELPPFGIGSKLLFENERVRVWDLRLAPGEQTPFHEHHCDFFYVALVEGQLQTIFPNGDENAPRSLRDGEVHFREVGEPVTHAARNVGSSDWRNIVVELKPESDGGASPARP